MVKALLYSWFVRTFAASTAVFIAAAYVFRNNDIWVGLRIMQIPVSVAVIVAFSEDIVAAILANDPSPRQKILLGINGTFFAVLVTAMIGYLWRLAGQPAWLFHSDITAFPVWVSIQAGIFHIMAKGAISEGLPRAERVRLAVWVGVSVLMLVILFARAADVRMFLETVRPYLEEVDG